MNENIIENHLTFLLMDDVKLNEFIKYLKQFNPIIYGGFIRDVLKSNEVGDLDIVLLIPHIHECFPFESKLNKFGGHRFTFDNIQVDVWNLKDTKWIEEEGLPPNISNLFKGTNRDENKVAYILNDRKFIDGRTENDKKDN